MKAECAVSAAVCAMPPPGWLRKPARSRPEREPHCGPLPTCRRRCRASAAGERRGPPVRRRVQLSQFHTPLSSSWGSLQFGGIGGIGLPAGQSLGTPRGRVVVVAFTVVVVTTGLAVVVGAAVVVVTLAAVVAGASVAGVGPGVGSLGAACGRGCRCRGRCWRRLRCGRRCRRRCRCWCRGRCCRGPVPVPRLVRGYRAGDGVAAATDAGAGGPATGMSAGAVSCSTGISPGAAVVSPGSRPHGRESGLR